MVRLTAVIVEPAGMLPVMSNASTPAAEFTHPCHTDKEMQSNAVAVITFSRIVLIKRIVFAWSDADDRGGRGRGSGKAKRNHE